MDSLTQAVFGATITGAIAPSGHRRKALLMGAVLGTVPDLDVFIDYGGAVENFTFHRAFSHSLLVLVPFSVLVWLALRRLWAPIRDAPLRWFGAIALALITHPLLDAHTAYGTQILWPLNSPPVMWATVFIIDPLFTLPLLIAAVIAAVKPRLHRGSLLLQFALSISILYLAWTWLAQSIVHRHATYSLAEMELREAPVFITPTPFNSLLWRIVVRTGDGYLEGFYSFLWDESMIHFQSYHDDRDALEAANHVWAVERLQWFSHGFLKAEVENERLLLSDLRMGGEPHYVFTHASAAFDGSEWHEIPTELLPMNYDRRLLPGIFQHIWSSGSH
jgi:inner membrane protein